MTTYPTSPLDAIGSAEGAFKVDDGGGDYKYGQGYNELIIGNMFHIPAPTPSNAIDLLQELLLKLPIEALRMFKDIIPGGVDDGFLNVLVAVDTIVDALQMSPALKLIDMIVIGVINLVLDIARAILSFIGMSYVVPPDIVIG